MNSNKQLYYFSLLLALVIHGPMLFISFEQTYDAYVHIFFAEHYAHHWFDQWNYKWYTGFTVTSYPPMTHQVIALASKLVGLKGGFILCALISVLIFIRGVFYFSRLWVSERSAAYAACAASLCSSYVEALHIFGQLPSITGIAILLNTLPVIYQWIRFSGKRRFALSLVLLSIITCTHHVTTIFGMVFFIFPVIGLALLDNAVARGDAMHVRGFLISLRKDFFRLLFFGISILVITVLSIFPYWYWSKSDPISQVPIPHGSRDSFIEVMSSGLIFFLIPWGLMLLFLPFLAQAIFKKRNIFLGISLTLAFVLGTGGTTPIPRALLGDTAFDILTLDRFTYWATILSLPFWGDFLYQLIQGSLKDYLVARIRPIGFKLLLMTLSALVIASAIFIMNIGFFKPFQPTKIDIKPIQNFLLSDNHAQWRYLTLGFGDQVAWLAANTEALSIDGNYHSARRLPEMTTRVVERLENAKYQGLQGLGALHQFLALPEKYNLKYIFNNDKFYEPILYFSGWNNVQRLENNIEVWEKPDVSPLADILPRKNIPRYQQLMWSIIPMSVLLLFLIGLLISHLFSIPFEKEYDFRVPAYQDSWIKHLIWAVMILSVAALWSIGAYITHRPHHSATNIIVAYFDAIDYKYFDKAYSYFDPQSRPEKEQILLDISLEDGIANSYGKLNSIRTDINYADDQQSAIATVQAEWMTSLKLYQTTHLMDLVNRDGKWYIIPPEHEKRIPPKTTATTATYQFSSLGKREAIINTTDHTDILDRPDITIKQSRLISNHAKYHVIGEIMNTDVVPAYLTVSAILLDEQENEILSYHVKDVVKHRLLPKETTAFRIDFDEIAVQACMRIFNSNYQESDDPWRYLKKPVAAKLSVKSLVTDENHYPFFGIQDVSISNQLIKFDLYNYGSEGVNIPASLTSMYHQDGSIAWVQTDYMESEIRALRQKQQRIVIPTINDITIISNLTNDDYKINGSVPVSIYPEASQATIHSFEAEEFLINIKAHGYIIK